MNKLNRRKFLGLGGSAFAGGFLVQNTLAGINIIKDKAKGVTPMIHATDLYHVHCDPDDHWDLASIYALAYGGLIDLKGILIDFPGKPSLMRPVLFIGCPVLMLQESLKLANMELITGFYKNIFFLIYKKN